MSAEGEDNWVPNDEELLAKINEADLTNDKVQELQARLVAIRKVDRSFNNVVSIDNLPVTGEDKLKKLNIIIGKLYRQFGAFTPDSFEMQLNAERTSTTGYAFVEYEEFEAAKKAVESTRGHKLDVKHILAPNLHSDFSRLAAVPDEYQAPVFVDSGDKEENPYSWLLDPACIDQYLARNKTSAEIYLNDPLRHPEPLSTTAAADGYVWSTEGKYLVTLHKQGAIMMKGKSWIQKKYRCDGVKQVAFSPKDSFFVAWSATAQEAENDKAVTVWHIASNRSKQFPGYQRAEKGKPINASWPIFSWSHDEAYFARALNGKLIVYSSDTFESFALEIPGLRSIAWSPTANHLAYWVEEGPKQTPSVFIIHVPTRRLIRQKILSSVLHCDLIWQDQGKYLAVKVEHYKLIKKKKGEEGSSSSSAAAASAPEKKSIGHKYLIFRTAEPSIPIEILDPKDLKGADDRTLKDSPLNVFAWEPHGDRFVILNSEPSNQAGVSLYNITEHKIVLLKTLSGRTINSVKWAPNGGVFVMAGVKPSSGALEFYSAELLETIGEGHHFNCTDIEWDPTGRFLMSIASALKQQHDCGFMIWKIDGTLHHKLQRENVFEFKWRPRPKTLLTAEMIQEIENNFAEITRVYSIADEVEARRLRTAKDVTRLRLLDEFAQLEREWQRIHAEEKEAREKIQNFADDFGYKTEIVEVDEVIEEFEEPL